MSSNEGCIDTVHAYDTAIITAGAMQKIIIGDASTGELATQISDFRSEHPLEYAKFFENCGWTVVGSGRDASLGYAHPTFTNGVRLVGKALFNALRRDCSANTFRKPVDCPPIASMAHAVSSPLYQRLQVKDFLIRFNKAIDQSPRGYDFSIKDYFHSPLGRATALDQSVNAPSLVSRDVGAALDRFFKKNPNVSRNPEEWGAGRAEYESSILQDYGNSRAMAVANGKSVGPDRYAHLVAVLGDPS